MVDNIQVKLKEPLLEKASEFSLDRKNMETIPDYVHLFGKAQPTDAPLLIVEQLKGYTSSKHRNEFLVLKSKLPYLWTRSYYIESVGRISDDSVKKYIEEQKNMWIKFPFALNFNLGNGLALKGTS